MTRRVKAKAKEEEYQEEEMTTAHLDHPESKENC